MIAPQHDADTVSVQHRSPATHPFARRGPCGSADEQSRAQHRGRGGKSHPEGLGERA
jgi:hypothetical protein